MSKRYKNVIGYKAFLIVWVSIWLMCFIFLSVYLYNRGELSIAIWGGFIFLGLLNPGLSVFKEIWGKVELPPKSNSKEPLTKEVGKNARNKT